MNISLKMLSALPMLLAASWAAAQAGQDCILEGTLDKQRAQAMGRDVYVQFHSARKASTTSRCNIQPGKKLAFREPKNAMIENVPDGSEVTYQYTESADGDYQWRLISVNMR